MLNSLLDFLRKCLRFNTIGNKMTLGKSEFWATFWRDNKEYYANIEKAVLIQRMIDGFKTKEYEKGFREGLSAIGNVMAMCESEEVSRVRNIKKDKKNVVGLKKDLTKKVSRI